MAMSRRGWTRIGIALGAALVVIALVASLSGLRLDLLRRAWLSGSPSKTTQQSRRNVSSVKGQLLTVDPSGKYLMNTITNKPVFITGDAPQLLVTEICAADVDTYLADRQARGFNALWVYIVENADQSNPPHNCNGDVPFDGADFTNFDGAYWAFVDAAIANAERRGLIAFINPGFVGLGPYGGYLATYQKTTPQTMMAYGTFLGNRYKKFSNIVWALGGDADPVQTVAFQNLASLATAIHAADPNHLITFEACRRGCDSGRNKSSLDAWPGPPDWLGINWVYNTYDTVIEGCRAAWNAGNPILPPIMGEDWYELAETISSDQVREEGYWEILSGCYAGRIFGNGPIFSFNSTHFKFGNTNWRSQLNSVGSRGQEFLGRLFRSREHWMLQPDVDHVVLIAGYNSRTTLNQAKESVRSFIYRQPARPGSSDSVAARTSDGQTIIAYAPSGRRGPIAIDMSKIVDASSQAKCWWFNPRDGSATLIGTFSTNGIRQFPSPDANDWVLVIDGLEANLAAPGSKEL